MARFKRRYAVLLIAIVLAAVAMWYYSRLPQVPLFSLNQSNLAQFSAQFDSAPSEPRVVLLLSPT